MNLAYIFMPVGILFLGVPATALCSSKVRARLRQPARRRESGMTSLARTPLNWVDLVRAGIGAWLIQNALSSARSGQDDLALIFLVVQVALISIAVLIQTIRLGRPMRVTGPLFFLSGLALVLCGPLVAGFALALGLSCALMLRRLGLVFAFVPPGVLVFGYLLGQLGIMTIVIAGAFALPLFFPSPFTPESLTRGGRLGRGAARKPRSRSKRRANRRREPQSSSRPISAPPGSRSAGDQSPESCR